MATYTVKEVKSLDTATMADSDYIILSEGGTVAPVKITYKNFMEGIARLSPPKVKLVAWLNVKDDTRTGTTPTNIEKWGIISSVTNEGNGNWTVTFSKSLGVVDASLLSGIYTYYDFMVQATNKTTDHKLFGATLGQHLYTFGYVAHTFPTNEATNTFYFRRRTGTNPAESGFMLRVLEVTVKKV